MIGEMLELQPQQLPVHPFHLGRLGTAPEHSEDNRVGVLHSEPAILDVFPRRRNGIFWDDEQGVARHGAAQKIVFFHDGVMFVVSPQLKEDFPPNIECFVAPLTPEEMEPVEKRIDF